MISCEPPSRDVVSTDGLPLTELGKEILLEVYVSWTEHLLAVEQKING